MTDVCFVVATSTGQRNTLFRSHYVEKMSLNQRNSYKSKETPRNYRRENWQIGQIESPIDRLAGGSRAILLFKLSARSSVKFAAQALQVRLQISLA
jgi:hypothetical protein